MVQKDIARRKGTEAEAVTEEEKAALEKVTGFSYDKLWNPENAGLKGTCLGYQYDDSAPAGTVINQKPAAGESVTAGSTVTYYLSNGPDPNKGDSDDNAEGQ